MITGRPSKYTEERAEQICSRIVEGESLRSICSAAEMPDKATVFRWLARHPDFRDQYRAAKELLMITMMDEMLEIADDSSRTLSSLVTGGRIPTWNGLPVVDCASVPGNG
jgi:hypothetical protein